MKPWLWLFVITLTACTHVPGDYQTYLARKNVHNLSQKKFDHCQGYGCRVVQTVSLSEKQWRGIAALFDTPPQTSTEERDRLAKAIGKLETVVGAMTNTSHDRGGTFQKIENGQLNCIDESVNTTTYLHLLKNAEFMKYHDIMAPQSRIPFKWPHQSAVIQDIETKSYFAMDSWFHDNGHPAEIVALGIWRGGWKPEKRAKR